MEESKSCIELMREEKNLVSEDRDALHDACSQLQTLVEQLKLESNSRAEQCTDLQAQVEQLQQKRQEETNTISEMNNEFKLEVQRMEEERDDLHNCIKQLHEETNEMTEELKTENERLNRELNELGTHFESTVELKDDFAYKVNAHEFYKHYCSFEYKLV